jgi:hypothetical protein
MDRLVQRVIEGDEASMLMSMATLLYGLPRPIDRVDAIAVLPGLGESWRIIDGVQAFNDNSSAQHLFIAGINDIEKTKVQPTLKNLSMPPFNLIRTENVHIQENAAHTKAQAEWLVEQVRANSVKSLALFVSPYHLLRAYCTVLKAFTKAGITIPLIPMPVAVNPATIIPETEVDAWTMSNGEKERIIKYQALDDVATHQELKDFMAWLCQQPILTPDLRG